MPYWRYVAVTEIWGGGSEARVRVYRMAERNIGVESLFERVHLRCAPYATEGAPDFVVRIAPEDIDRERARFDREDALEGRTPRTVSEAYLEELAVYRQIAERLPAYDTFLFHGSAVAVDGRGYLFAAKSGTGKSTHARLWQQFLGDRLTYVNDDKPLIRITPQEALVYGTPYDGKHHLSSNVTVPLEAVCLLRRGEQNAIHPISAGEAFPRLLQQAYSPQDRAALQRTVVLLQALTARVRLYELSCNMDIAAAREAFEAMAPAMR